MNTIKCPKCRKEMDPCDVVRNIFYKEWVQSPNPNYGKVHGPPDPSNILFVHSWVKYEVPEWEKTAYYKRQSGIVADFGTYIPKPGEYCEVPQEGVPLYLAKILGLSTMEEAHHEDNITVRRAKVEALNNIADATHDVADATRQAGYSIGKAIAMPNHWGNL